MTQDNSGFLKTTRTRKDRTGNTPKRTRQTKRKPWARHDKRAE